jgi:acylphosphatase
MADRTVRMLVGGLVQGVGFRYYVYHRAQALGVTGYARNLPSGQVEVVASGERGLLDEFIDAVRIGPRYASVSQLEVEDISLREPFTDFRIK